MSDAMSKTDRFFTWVVWGVSILCVLAGLTLFAGGFVHLIARPVTELALWDGFVPRLNMVAFSAGILALVVLATTRPLKFNWWGHYVPLALIATYVVAVATLLFRLATGTI